LNYVVEELKDPYKSVDTFLLLLRYFVLCKKITKNLELICAAWISFALCRNCGFCHPSVRFCRKWNAKETQLLCQVADVGWCVK